MNCKEFDDLAGSYLSDELLVETNHEVIRHLESCPSCRTRLAEQRDVRQKLRRAVRNSVSLDPRFAASVREAVRLDRTGRPSVSLMPALGVAVLLFTVLLGVTSYLRYSGSSLESARTDVVVAVRESAVMELLHEAFGNHKSCGLKFAKNAAKPASDDTDYVALKQGFASDLELVEKHDCVYRGRRYSHTIFRLGDRVISVLRTKSDATTGEPQTVLSVPIEQLQVAEFTAGGMAGFVISDLTETENVQIARLISK